jgi:hypothetical protein
MGERASPSSHLFTPFYPPLRHKWAAIERYQRLSLWESARYAALKAANISDLRERNGAQHNI